MEINEVIDLILWSRAFTVLLISTINNPSNSARPTFLSLSLGAFKTLVNRSFLSLSAREFLKFSCNVAMLT